MFTLAFDTCLDVCSVALIDRSAGDVLAARHVPMTRGHAEALLPLVDDTLKEAGLVPGRLSRVAVTRGPGTFTGVRIGLSAARGLAISPDVDVVALTSLEALALCANAHDDTDRPVAALIDARRGELYGAVFSGTGTLMTDPMIVPADGISDSLPDGELRVCGTGAALAAAADSRFILSAAEPLPVASVWGPAAAAAGPRHDLPVPVYLRAPDAKPPAADARVRRTQA